MALLQPVKMTQAAAKVGLFGRGGSGKTTTSLLLLIGLSKHFHNGAPIAMFDTEDGSDFIEGICRVESIELVVAKSRAFSDMKAALIEAEAKKCCSYLVDSYTAPWQEVNETIKEKHNLRGKRLPIQYQDELKTLWNTWVAQMKASPLHIVMAGRLGYEWDNEEDEDGSEKLVRLGTKLKGEGDAGYEPNLLIEMEAMQEAGARIKKSRRKKGTNIHHCYVLKDRLRALNGKAFTFADINDYKPGNYKKVFETFLPHFERLAIGKGEHRTVDYSRRSDADLPASGESVYYAQQRQKTIALEELKENIAAVWPGQDGPSKKARQIVLETQFGTLSWTAVESSTIQEIESGVGVVKELRQQIQDGADVSTPELLTARLIVCKDALVRRAREAAEAAVM